MQTLTEFLKEQRLNRGLTQTEVADKLGISYVGYSFLENGKHKPKIRTLNKISNFYGIGIEELRKMVEHDDFKV